MKILFLTENFYPDCDANGNCVRNVAKAMVAQGNEVVILCSAPKKCDSTIEAKDGYRVAFFHYDNHIKKEQAIAAFCNNFKYGLSLCFRVIQRRIVLQYSLAHVRWFAAMALKKRLIRLLQTEHFDAVISAFFPLEPAIVCTDLIRKNSLVCPHYIYQLDTYTTNSTLPACLRQHRSQVVKKIYWNAQGIFITPLMHNEIKAICGTQKIYEKFKVIEFPNFFERTDTDDTIKPFRLSQDGEIACIYAGALYQKIRNPEYTFRLFGALSKIGVHLYVYGKCDYDVSTSKASDSNNVHFCGQVSTQDYFQLIQNADVLVNIGNSDTTQLPSKIFDYFATGNPLINISKTAECPTRKYSAQYPAAIDIVESEICFQDNVNLLMRFFSKFRLKQQMPVVNLKEIFKSCTPDFVAKQMLDFMIH